VSASCGGGRGPPQKMMDKKKEKMWEWANVIVAE